MICKFCGQETEKLVRAHIIPAWMMRRMFDEKNRLIHIDGLRDGPLDARIKQDGRLGDYIDNQLTCRNCDVRFSKWEGSAREALLGGRVTLNQEVGFSDRHGEIRYARATGFDYRHFKLFILSMLWRMSVSKVSCAEAVSLGKHERLIHAMLLSENPGGEAEYPVAIFRLDLDGDSVAIVVAYNGKWDGLHAVYFAAGGFLFIVVCSSQVPRRGRSLFLSQDGTAVIASMDPRRFPWVRKAVDQMPPDASERIDRLISGRRSQ